VSTTIIQPQSPYLDGLWQSKSQCKEVVINQENTWYAKHISGAMYTYFGDLFFVQRELVKHSQQSDKWGTAEGAKLLFQFKSFMKHVPCKLLVHMWFYNFE